MSDNTPAPMTRAALYARLRTQSREEVTLAEMQRLGFWPENDPGKAVAEQLIQRESELVRALRELGSDLRVAEDPALALKAMHKERKAKARARREETRERRARERFERANAWHQRRAGEILYLGQGVSAGLGEARSDADKLARAALPAMHDAKDLAQAMGLSLPELRFLAFDRRVSRISHYRRFAVPKKTGGERIISAPMPRLKRGQYWVLDNLLARAAVHPAAHGFRAGRSIVTNAGPHVGRAVVINVDLKDFFPSIGMQRVAGVFRQLGYSKQIATILALLCTESATEQVSIDGETFHVAHGPRVLPQGAPTSPALTNILCRRLDARLEGAAAKLGFAYTRYADDLTFSGGEETRRLAGKLLWRVRQIVADEGFTPHPDKQHVMRDSQRQGVTGIVVNEKPAVDRTTLRRFRATLFQVERDGPAGKAWNGNANVLAALEGYAQFIRMVDPAKGTPLLARVRAARERWSDTGSPAVTVAKAISAGNFRALSAQGKAPWPGFWQAGMAPAPVLEKTQEQVVAMKKEARQLARSHAATSPTPGGKARNARSLWHALLLQILIACFLAIAFRSPWPIIAMLALFYLSRRDRSAYWTRFIGIQTLAVAGMLALMKH
ncbi:reverse transcriptase family protein [Pseudoduganella umbonata]|uniref:RNA-directed DNA polymerase n=1 Tax=Pseudoduganella umbonata TaxID=864828 RepID=A0A4P8HVF7_9BURK|nr:reverse transcriptase family protein [Pseudoduganella umbonata]MBB3225391.1 retron-type reverse transcriptase [Pseudoduganella umbonata]QCP13933.1 RNA-directed DNA polymerase [Pseudoduganella umbonata]